MWIHEQLSGKKWSGQPFTHLQHKLDGWRVTLFKQPKGKILGFGKDRDKAGEDRRMDLEFFGRFPRLHVDLAEQIKKMPAYTSVDCEIMTLDGERADVITALKDETRKIPLKILAFAVPVHEGKDERKAPLGFARAISDTWGFDFAPFVDARTFYGLHEGNSVAFDGEQAVEEERERLSELAKQAGIEGWMLKNGGQYGTWWKVKPTPTVDCVVTGIIEGEGKYTSQVGSLVVSVWQGTELVEIASCSGMPDDERLRMTKEGKKIIGRVCEVKYQLLGKKGRLTHPRFVRWRPDKPAAQCTYDQLKDNE